MTLDELGVAGDRLEAIAEVTCRDGTTIDNQPHDPTAETVYEALLLADELGRTLS